MLTLNSDLVSAEKVLLITAERISDAIFCTPAVKLFKESLPHIQFDVIALSPDAADIYSNNPAINLVQMANNNLKIRYIARDYPLVINLMYEAKKYLNKLPVPLLSIGKPDMRKHHADQIIDFVRFLLTNTVIEMDDYRYELFPQPEHFRSLEAQLKQLGIDENNDILIGCQLGCHDVAQQGWKFWNRHRHRHSKVWEIENYIELAKRLQRLDKRIKIVLTGSSGEKFMGKRFLEQCPQAISLIGKTHLLEVTALMDKLTLYITHDTGTLHIACARNAPLVALFGPVPPICFTGPYPEHNDYFTVIAKKSMNQISVQGVYDIVVKKLKEKLDPCLLAAAVC